MDKRKLLIFILIQTCVLLIGVFLGPFIIMCVGDYTDEKGYYFIAPLFAVISLPMFFISGFLIKYNFKYVNDELWLANTISFGLVFLSFLALFFLKVDVFKLLTNPYIIFNSKFGHIVTAFREVF